MDDNEAINKLTGIAGYSRYYGANISSKDLAGNLTYTGDLDCVKSNWDYSVTLNEDAIKDIVEKIAKRKEIAKITPDEGPEVPKWTGFLDI